MNSCLCEHQVLLACSWPVTALEIDMPARLTDWLLLSSGEEHALLHSPTVWASWECGSCRHCFCIFFFFFANIEECALQKTTSQYRRERKSSTFILERLRSSDRVTKSVRHVVRPWETAGDQERGTEWQTQSGEPGVGPQSPGTRAGRAMPFPVSCFHLLARRGTAYRLGKNCRHH